VGTPAHAATLTVTGTDPLVVDTNYSATDALVGTFATVNLTGTAQLTTSVITPFTIVDPRGTAAGWHLQLVVGDFVGTSGAAQAATYTIPANTVVMDTPIVQGSDGQFQTTWTLQGGTDFTGTGVNIVSAKNDQTSMGTFVVSPLPLRLTVPTDAYKGGYTSTATVTLGNVP
jgi:hypothetical protein